MKPSSMVLFLTTIVLLSSIQNLHLNKEKNDNKKANPSKDNKGRPRPKNSEMVNSNKNAETKESKEEIKKPIVSKKSSRNENAAAAVESTTPVTPRYDPQVTQTDGNTTENTEQTVNQQDVTTENQYSNYTTEQREDTEDAEHSETQGQTQTQTQLEPETTETTEPAEPTTESDNAPANSMNVISNEETYKEARKLANSTENSNGKKKCSKCKKIQKESPFKAENQLDISNTVVKVGFEKFVFQKVFSIDPMRRITTSGLPTIANPWIIPEYTFSFVVAKDLARLHINFLIPSAGQLISNSQKQKTMIFFLYFNDKRVSQFTTIHHLSSINADFYNIPIELNATIYNVPKKTHKISVGLVTHLQDVTLNNVHTQGKFTNVLQSTCTLEGEVLDN